MATGRTAARGCWGAWFGSRGFLHPLSFPFLYFFIFVNISSALSSDLLVIIHCGKNSRNAQAPRKYYSTFLHRPCSPNSTPDSEIEGLVRKAYRRHEPAEDSLPELDSVSPSPRAVVSPPGVQ